MMNQNVTKSLEKSKNVLEEKRKIVKRKICIKKTHTVTIIAMNCVQDQLIKHKEFSEFILSQSEAKISMSLEVSL